MKIVRTLGFASTVMALFNIYMMNLIILSKSVSRECRAFMYGFCCGIGALGAVIGLTLGQLIYDKTKESSTMMVLEILLVVGYIIFYFILGGKK